MQNTKPSYLRLLQMELRHDKIARRWLAALVVMVGVFAADTATGGFLPPRSDGGGMGEFLNRVTLIGRLGHEPSLRTTSSGKPLVSLSIVTSETWQKDGEQQERATWHKIVVFAEPLVAYVTARLSKGCWVYVEGKLQISEWEDKEGVKRQTAKIVLDSFSGVLRQIEARASRQTEGGAPRQKRARHQSLFAPGERPLPAPLIDPDLNDPLPF